MIQDLQTAETGSAPASVSSGFRLQFRGGPRDGQIVRVRASKCTIGSAQECTLRIVCPGVEPAHCMLIRGSHGIAVRGLAGETYVNGDAIQDTLVHDGDILSFGPLQFEFLPLEVASPGEAKHAPDHLARELAQHAEILRLQAELEQARDEFAAREADLLGQLSASDARFAERHAELHRAQEQADRELADARQSLDIQLQTLLADQESLGHQRQAIQAERDALDHQRQAWESERDAVLAERDLWSQEREAWEREQEEQQRRLHERTHSQEESRNQIDSLTQGGDVNHSDLVSAFRLQLQEAQEAREAAENKWRQAHQELQTQLASSRAELFEQEQLLDATRRELETVSARVGADVTQDLELQITLRDEALRASEAQLTRHAAEATDMRQLILQLQRDLEVAKAASDGQGASQEGAGDLESEWAKLEEQVAYYSRFDAELAARHEELETMAASIESERAAFEQQQVDASTPSTASHLTSEELVAIERLERRCEVLQADRDECLMRIDELKQQCEAQAAELLRAGITLNDELSGRSPASGSDESELLAGTPSFTDCEEQTVEQFQGPHEVVSEDQSALFSQLAAFTRADSDRGEVTGDEPMSLAEQLLGQKLNRREPEQHVDGETEECGQYPTEECEPYEKAAPSLTTSRSAADEEEGSIDDYMAALMQRLGGAKPTPRAVASYTPDDDSDDGVRVEVPPAQPDPAPAKPKKLHPSEFVPRAVAPEANSNLKALRAVANSSTRSAIDKHQRARFEQMATISWASAAFLLAFALALASLVETVLSATMLIAVGGMVGVVVAVLRALSYSRRARAVSDLVASADSEVEEERTKVAPKLGLHPESQPRQNSPHNLLMDPSVSAEDASARL